MAEEIGYLKNDPNFATRAIHEGNEPEQWNSMAVVPPISMATTFKQDGPADFKVCVRFWKSKYLKEMLHIMIP